MEITNDWESISLLTILLQFNESPWLPDLQKYLDKTFWRQPTLQIQLLGTAYKCLKMARSRIEINWVFVLWLTLSYWVMVVANTRMVYRVICPKDPKLRSAILRQAENENHQIECAGK